MRRILLRTLGSTWAIAAAMGFLAAIVGYAFARDQLPTYINGALAGGVLIVARTVIRWDRLHEYRAGRADGMRTVNRDYQNGYAAGRSAGFNEGAVAGAQLRQVLDAMPGGHDIINADPRPAEGPQE